MGDDYKTYQAEPQSISDSVTAAHFIFSNKGSIDRDENVGVIENTNFPDPILRKNLTGRQTPMATTTNYKPNKDTTIQNANIRLCLRAEKQIQIRRGSLRFRKADYSEKGCKWSGYDPLVQRHCRYQQLRQDMRWSLTEMTFMLTGVDDAAPDRCGTLTVL